MDTKYNRQYAIAQLKRLAKVLKENGIDVHSVFLFGSFANESDSNLDWSDIDAAIVSDSFSGSRFDDNKRLFPLSIKVDPRIETHPYTIFDFENSPFAQEEIRTKGISISLD
jgi:predicted nucleotidyltransferase